MNAPHHEQMNSRYTRAEITRYEAIYGRNFVSPGGSSVNAEVLACARLDPSSRVLDVGCGLGGSAFYIAHTFGARVLGIDIAHDMIDIGRSRLAEQRLEHLVTLVEGDCLHYPFPDQYDLVYSRDSFLHIDDKARLFQRLGGVLAESGRLLFTDYCLGDTPPDDEFRQYVAQHGYCLHTIDDYAGLLRDAGFEVERAENRTPAFIDIHRREIGDLAGKPIADADRRYLERRWRAKIDWARRDIQRWALFLAR